MSNKFTGITSAGSAIPVYDKDAHSALEQKLDTSAFSSVSGEFATVDDVVAAVSGKADTSAIPSLDGYATQEWVGEQGFLTEVPESAVSGFATHEEVESATSGVMQTSGLEYDGDKISGYMGSAFKAGDEFPQSATEAIGYVTATSANIDSTIDNVSSNSGVWGGSALPISAGPGIKFDMVNGILVASTDETVLWTGNNSDTSFTLSEPISNFKVIELYNEKNTNSCRILVDGTVSAGFNYNRLWLQPDNTIMQRYYAVTSNDGQTFGVRYVRGTDISTAGATTYGGGVDWYLENTKIVGINRVSGGN